MQTRTSVREHGDVSAGARLVTGAASMTVRPLLDGPRRDARVLAAFPRACYLELISPAEPGVLALVAGDAVRLPNALVVPDAAPLAGIHPGMPAQIGTGVVRTGPVLVGAARWWDPTPALHPATPAHLAASLARLEALCAASDRRPGLTGADGPAALAAACAADALADAVEHAERVVGLGPGLTPSGDDVLCGLLLALRLLGTTVTTAAAPADKRAAPHTGTPHDTGTGHDTGGPRDAATAHDTGVASRGGGNGAVTRGPAGGRSVPRGGTRRPAGAAPAMKAAARGPAGPGAGAGVVAGVVPPPATGGPGERRPGDRRARRVQAATDGAAAVRLADWIGVAVTSDATTRTTALSAALLRCAATGQASGEVAAVLRAMTLPEAGRALSAAVPRLLATGHTSGADLAWGLAAGCRAVIALTRTAGRPA